MLWLSLSLLLYYLGRLVDEYVQWTGLQVVVVVQTVVFVIVIIIVVVVFIIIIAIVVFAIFTSNAFVVFKKSFGDAVTNASSSCWKPSPATAVRLRDDSNGEWRRSVRPWAKSRTDGAAVKKCPYAFQDGSSDEEDVERKFRRALWRDTLGDAHALISALIWTGIWWWWKEQWSINVFLLSFSFHACVEFFLLYGDSRGENLRRGERAVRREFMHKTFPFSYVFSVDLCSFHCVI